MKINHWLDRAVRHICKSLPPEEFQEVVPLVHNPFHPERPTRSRLLCQSPLFKVICSRTGYVANAKEPV
eukprot:scaffold356322_cov37-Prasinocladus_malaysianus.AAC.1